MFENMNEINREINDFESININYFFISLKFDHGVMNENRYFLALADIIVVSKMLSLFAVTLK